MSIVSKASDYIALKDRVRKEVKRRKYTGSVESYGGANYDFTVAPVVGADVLAEHYNKINEPLRAVNSNGLLENVRTGDDIREVTILDAKTTVFEAKPAYGSNHGCKASCTGLCTGNCSGTCSGCSGCSGCTGCSGCGSGCASGCSGCGSGCASGCSGCSGGCTGSCTVQCGTGCTGCSGCGNSCSTSCGSGCSGSDC